MINPNFKTQYYMEKQEKTQPYLLEPVSIIMDSHHLCYEIGKWISGDPKSAIFLFCELGVTKLEQHALQKCTIFAHIKDDLLSIDDTHSIITFLNK